MNGSAALRQEPDPADGADTIGAVIAKDLAFSPNHQCSQRGVLCRRHGVSQVFDELLAQQIQRRIRQRKYPEGARDLEAHVFSHRSLHRRKIDSMQTVRPPAVVERSIEQVAFCP